MIYLFWKTFEPGVLLNVWQCCVHTWTHCNLFFGSAYSLRLFSSCFRLMSCWLFVVQGPFVLAWIIDLQCRSWCDEANTKKFLADRGPLRSSSLAAIWSPLQDEGLLHVEPLCAILCHFILPRCLWISSAQRFLGLYLVFVFLGRVLTSWGDAPSCRSWDLATKIKH